MPLAIEYITRDQWLTAPDCLFLSCRGHLNVDRTQLAYAGIASRLGQQGVHFMMAALGLHPVSAAQLLRLLLDTEGVRNRFPTAVLTIVDEYVANAPVVRSWAKTRDLTDEDIVAILQFFPAAAKMIPAYGNKGPTPGAFAKHFYEGVLLAISPGQVVIPPKPLLLSSNLKCRFSLVPAAGVVYQVSLDHKTVIFPELDQRCAVPTRVSLLWTEECSQAQGHAIRDLDARQLLALYDALEVQLRPDLDAALEVARRR